MEFRAEDPHLNLFWAYGTPKHEDNVTRALAILLSRPPAAAEMTRSFLRAVGNIQPIDGEERLHEHSSGFHQVLDLCIRELRSVSITMQETSDERGEEDVLTDSGEQGPYVVCLALTPHHDLEPGGEGGNRSRADAVVRIALPDNRPSQIKKYDSLVITIETKLKSKPNWKQVRSHASHIKVEPDASAALAWSDLFQELQNRPEYLNQEPLVQDFDEFIARFPKLTGWTGIDSGDLDKGDNKHRCDVKLQQLAAQLVENEENRYEQSERQRGGCDYTIRLKGPGRRAGNIGVAVWGSDDLILKLPVGWKTRREVDRWLSAVEENSSRREAVFTAVGEYRKELIRQFQDASLSINTGYRFLKYPHARWYAVKNWEISESGDGLELDEVLRRLFKWVREIHPGKTSSKRLTPELLEQAQDNLDPNRSQKLTDEFSDILKNEPELAKWFQYAAIGLHARIPAKDVAGVPPERLIEKFKAIQREQVAVLTAVVNEDGAAK